MMPSDAPMELRFECPTCGQHLSATPAQVGVTAQCPNCNAAVTVPIQSTLCPKLPTSPQPQEPAQNTQAALITQRKARKSLSAIFVTGVVAIIVIGVAAIGVWLAYNSSKPKLLAKIQVTPKILRITNGNDTAWDGPSIILNDGFAGPILVVGGLWNPNETRELPLRDFKGRFNHQPFKPEYEEVREVMIDAHGFQLGIYTTR